MMFIEFALRTVFVICSVQESPSLAEKAATAEFEISDSELTTLFEDLRNELKAKAGLELPKETVARVATRREIADVVTRETMRRLLKITKDEVAAKTEAERAAQALAANFIAKYSFDDRAILVCVENIEMQKKSSGLPTIVASRNGLRALLTHESVHAIDHARFDFPAKLLELEDVDAINAFTAVVEGHAQFVARRACKALDNEAPLDAYTNWISKGPEGDGAVDLFARIAQAGIATAYTDGERFIRALYDKGGEEAIERAFREPPSDPLVIANPGWFLDPAARPKETIDTEAGLGAFVAAFDSSRYQSDRVTPSNAELHAAFALVPDQGAVDALLTQIAKCRIARLAAVKDPADGFLICALSSFRDAASAANYSVMFRELDAIKVKRMTKGVVRVLESSLEEVQLERDRVDFFEKKMANGNFEFPVRTALLVRGPIALELIASAKDVAKDEWIALAVKVMDAAYGIESAAK